MWVHEVLSKARETRPKQKQKKNLSPCKQICNEAQGEASPTAVGGDVGACRRVIGTRLHLCSLYITQGPKQYRDATKFVSWL